MSDGRAEAAAAALLRRERPMRGEFRDEQRKRIGRQGERAVYAIDQWDAEHGIVRVDCRSDATVERVAEALHEVEYGTVSGNPDHDRWTWDGEGTTEAQREACRASARAVLARLEQG